MAWIEVHQSLQNHPKVSRMATALGIPKPYATGLLVNLWLWALDYAPHGDISIFEPREIADGAGWTGDAAEFQKALLVTLWVDSDGKLHDWDEYRAHFQSFQDKQDKKRELVRKRVERHRERKRRELGISNDGVTHNVTLGNAYKTSNTSKTVQPPLPPRGGQGDEAEAGGGEGGGDKAPEEQDVVDVVDGFKLAFGQELGRLEWDAVYGRSTRKKALKLLTLFSGDVEKCLQCIEGITKHATRRGWSDWTPGTVVERAADWANGRLTN